MNTELAIQTKLPVMEAFYTLQGEGAYAGQAAYFIRLGGCDVGCVWCDVKDSWPMEAHPLRTIQDLVSEAALYPGRLAVITGGEPLMHNLDALTASLKEAGFRTHIETSGTHPLSGTWDWICFSPKKFKDPLPEIFDFAHEFKAIVFHKSDISWAAQMAGHLNSTCKLMLQPEWSKRDQMTPLIVDWVKDNPKWSISLQTHKYLNIP